MIRQLSEQRDLANIKYWEVSHTEVTSTGLKLGDGGLGRLRLVSSGVRKLP